MTKYKFYIGLNHKDNGQQVTSVKAAKIIITNILGLNGINGATLFEAAGMWEGEIEKTIITEVVDAENKISNETIKAVCETIKEVLYQNAVMVEKIKANVDFI